MSSHFSSSLFSALGEWQRGWQEDPQRREPIGRRLEQEALLLPPKYRSISGPCYRKRFIYKQDVLPFFIHGNLDAGTPTSWSTDYTLVRDFKDLWRPDAITGAIFEHTPSRAEVILNIPALWADQNFVLGAEQYIRSQLPFGDALDNFRDKQKEIILKSTLKPSDTIAMSGIPTDFDIILTNIGISEEEKRDDIARALIASGKGINEPMLIEGRAALEAISATQDAFLALIRLVEALRVKV